MTTLDSINQFDIYICDFEDSYTFNLYSYFVSHGYSVKVFSYQDFLFIDSLHNIKSKFVLVFGPGPGHPKSYIEKTKKLIELRKKDNCFTVGICLGHQILCFIEGQKIVRSKDIRHGRTVDVALDKLLDSKNCFKAQRYNSLSVETDKAFQAKYLCLFDSLDELAVVSSDNFLSCQFHPESVGTDEHSFIFDRITQFLR